MFWQETSFPENTRKTAYNVHTFHLLGDPDRAGLLTLAGLKRARPENFRQKVGRAEPSRVVVFRPLQGSKAYRASEGDCFTKTCFSHVVFRPLQGSKAYRASEGDCFTKTCFSHPMKTGPMVQHTTAQ